MMPNYFTNKQNIREIGVFVIIGVLNTAIDFTVLNLLIIFFGISSPVIYFLFKTFSFLAAVMNSYVMNKRYTFSHRGENLKTFPKFISVTALNFFINVGISSLVFATLSASFTFNPFLVANASAVLGISFGMILNFLSYKFIVFKKD
ncbi:MAG: hypothetical protein A2825_03710 [Candidatus Taylorbacteria bacterium RIFCSPHIGHO2_01_FULL_43_120]|nr:MAG: hypothetical protein A2825_03710 [Candidatus Taylorbacteria bacterium RIFCSPHIGHO2_01_FULL_43_120]OHA22054.1 MAG: hypothetical protein A3B98_04095 [Candidatus Taylorbacteria bacterium RIFCSPHIGHO2_02_FULL_43_55]OHA30367.1 MAG: hypothetical protein A3E92_00680 [Candidatus Taylorbacteria bacterium RIFCSPHIGHO2_12_FULL_42_34]OHA31027.1 MAG: hypothetical protein A3B09_04040 [Candidatus Taylorbacteria bacterium RIFCSPLOWO2_01_FULL_43_83]